jgi:hypothetical protein
MGHCKWVGNHTKYVDIAGDLDYNETGW